MAKRRVIFSLAVLSTVALGLASRKIPGLFPEFLGKYPGDALWAIMIFCVWGFLASNWSVAKLAVYALITSYADELSQLYQAQWIIQIRQTTPGHLVLGSVFSWLDMLAYTVGIAAVLAGSITLKLIRSKSRMRH